MNEPIKRQIQLVGGPADGEIMSVAISVVRLSVPFCRNPIDLFSSDGPSEPAFVSASYEQRCPVNFPAVFDFKGWDQR